jgi:hypothetical protein
MHERGTCELDDRDTPVQRGQCFAVHRFTSPCLEVADDETRRVDAESCPPDVCIFAGEDPRLMIHHMGITRLLCIVFNATGRKTVQIMRQ